MRHTSLMTDMYQLTMAASYFMTNEPVHAVFEMQVRRLPKQRSYLVLAGLEDALDYLEQMRFTGEEVDYLRTIPAFSAVAPSFFEELRDFRFEGDVYAMPEGTLFFGGEPVLRVEAKLLQAQIVETYLLSCMNHQTMIASKAARVVDAAQGRSVVDFGARRAHGAEAAVLAAKASFIAGCAATSNLEAGKRFGIPTSGTMAHSYVLAHDSEEEAFRRYVALFRENSVLLVDTYETLRGTETAARLCPNVQAIRLDSGDLSELSKGARTILDNAGCTDTRILASGDLDEYSIAALIESGTPIDGFGVGTQLITSADAPYLSMVYKIVESERDGRRIFPAKFSPNKRTYPGRKNVFRFEEQEKITKDVVVLCDEPLPEGAKALIVQQMIDGKRCNQKTPLEQLRKNVREQVVALPDNLRKLKDFDDFPVEFSPRLLKLAQKSKENAGV